MEWNEVLSAGIGCYIALYLFHQNGKGSDKTPPRKDEDTE